MDEVDMNTEKCRKKAKVSDVHDATILFPTDSSIETIETIETLINKLQSVKKVGTDSFNKYLALINSPRSSLLLVREFLYRVASLTSARRTLASTIH